MKNKITYKNLQFILHDYIGYSILGGRFNVSIDVVLYIDKNFHKRKCTNINRLIELPYFEKIYTLKNFKIYSNNEIEQELLDKLLFLINNLDDNDKTIFILRYILGIKVLPNLCQYNEKKIKKIMSKFYNEFSIVINNNKGKHIKQIEQMRLF